MKMVLQAKFKIIGGGSNGQQKFITYQMEMPVSYCVYSKIQEKILYGKILYDVREILETLCKYKQVDIIAGAVCIDHVNLSVAIPPKLSVSQFMGYLKGKSTLMIYDRHPELQSKWNKAFWARGYYVETIGNITDEAVQKYIKEQAEEARKEDSRGTALQRTSNNACGTALMGEQYQWPLGGPILNHHLKWRLITQIKGIMFAVRQKVNQDGGKNGRKFVCWYSGCILV